MWRNTEQGFKILDPHAGVEWDESWRGSLRVLRDRPDDERIPRKEQPQEVSSDAATTPEQTAEKAAETAS